MLTTFARSAARAARPAARVPFASLSLAARGVHTLPQLDYPYNVRTRPLIIIDILRLNPLALLCIGTRAPHFWSDHGASPQEAPSDLRQRP